MKKSLTAAIVSVAAALALSAQALPEPANPAVKMFAENIIFYMNFDEGTPDPSISTFKPIKRGNVTYADDGFFGKALKTGEIAFNVGDKIPTDTAGTVIMWVKALNAPEKKENGRFEPACTYYVISLNSGSRRLLGCKPSGGLWGHVNLSNRTEFPTTAAGKRAIASVSPSKGSVAVKNWLAGQWRLMVFTWTSEKIGVSLDGCPLNETAIVEPLAVPRSISLAFMAGSDKNPDSLQYSIDECMILNKKITDEELLKLYTDSMAKRQALTNTPAK